MYSARKSAEIAIRAAGEAVNMKFRKDIIIPGYMTDVNHLLRPVSFMDLAQQIAIDAGQAGGYGDPALLEKHNAVWIIARMKVEFDKMPFILANTSLETWHRGVESMIFLRDYQLLSESGESLVRASSSWIVMDADNRRILRTNTLGDVIPLEAECSERALSSDSAKIVLPAGIQTEKIWEHRVAYSDVDYNHHANNAKYTQWVIDALPQEFIFSHTLKTIELNFNKEARPGETVEFFHAESDGTHYIEGRCNGMQVFISKLEFTCLQ